MTRRYVKTRRAGSEAETRRRIVEATVALHQEVGPASTTVVAIAERAGIERRTVYNHFPDLADLFVACRTHFLAAHPPPDPAQWLEVADPDDRLARGIEELYRYYAANEAMIHHALRDSERVPSGRGFMALHDAAAEALGEGRPGLGAHQRAAIGLVTDFAAWRSLSRAGLAVPEAAATAVAMLGCVLAPTRR
jgi:AcrR family transcriptional regulator